MREKSRGIYPASLARDPDLDSALRWYRRWQDSLGWRFDARCEPWVPMGHAGPALVLGHSRPGSVPAPLPWPCFQPVLLSPEDHARAIALVAERLALARGGEGEWRGPRQRLSGSFIPPVGEAAALRFMEEYFPSVPAELEQARRSLQRRGGGSEPLPHGYSAAAWLLSREGPVADTRALALRSEAQGRLPESLRSELRVVAEQGRVLWAACDRLPQPLLEDRLLNEAGEGWTLHLLLDARDRPALPEPDQGEEAPQARTCVSIDLLGSRTRDGGAQGPGPGVIRITQREIAELERYDPRRSDRDPARIFLRELSASIRAGASDLHLEPGLERARVRMRVDGIMEERLEMSAEFGQTLVGAAKEMLGLPAERFVPQDGACTIQLGDDMVAARVSSYPIRKRRQKLVLRFLPRRGSVPPLDSLLPAAQARMLRHASRRPHGLVLVCGPTGSGKTTTVFSTLADLNSPELNITTMEEPVEYELEGVNQAELDPLRGAGWEVLLKGFLRQDPDAGLIGEIRDRATAEVAIRQALTGHLVFATLHTLSCAQTVERLLNLGVEPSSLASALTLVVSQRLMRRLCPECKLQRTASEEERSLLSRHGQGPPSALWAPRAGGCPRCRAGYVGRVAAVEMLPATREVARLIEDRRPARDFSEWAASRGLPTVFESALRLAVEGTSSLEEAMEWREAWEDYPWQT